MVSQSLEEPMTTPMRGVALFNTVLLEG